MPTEYAALMTPAALLAWLRRQPDAAPVGVPALSTCCPLARYLREGTGHVWRVLAHSAEPAVRGPLTLPLPLPPWAARFVFLVDRERSERISAAQAKDCLYRAVKETTPPMEELI